MLPQAEDLSQAGEDAVGFGLVYNGERGFGGGVGFGEFRTAGSQEFGEAFGQLGVIGEVLSEAFPSEFEQDGVFQGDDGSCSGLSCEQGHFAEVLVF